MKDADYINDLTDLLEAKPDTLIMQVSEQGGKWTRQKMGNGRASWQKSCRCCAPTDPRDALLPAKVLYDPETEKD